ncbi:MAG: 6,7-dimethyl-8-ribityllumazine synthase [Nitrospira sp.]|nr:6,7-dimethyl-8-ribityllumazine synthase [Nitrospira sp.]
MKPSGVPRPRSQFRFGIVVSLFNRSVTSRLLASCLDGLARQGVKRSAIEVVKVPGAFEIPLVARTMAATGRFDAIICLGAVIRGETPHFDYICAETTRGIGQVALETGIPVIFGVLTTETVSQAVERADPSTFDRGGAAAKAAVQMAKVMKRFGKTTPPKEGWALSRRWNKPPSGH